MLNIISEKAITNRANWVNRIQERSSNFTTKSELIEQQLITEISEEGTLSLVNHLRLCGNIPESYGHDTSEEKQYSKYTDTLLALGFRSMGLQSLVITERADVADVEVFGKKFSFVADAKAFRLSRTAKNQKDFKIQAMDRWKHGKPHAVVICPIHQLPSKSSQIYLQAITVNVTILTYAHLALLVRYAELSKNKSVLLLYKILTTVPALNPSKSAVDYWLGVNQTILSYSKTIRDLWREEKIAAMESVELAKVEALKHLAIEREKIMRLSHEEALQALLKASKIDNKIRIIQKISDNGLIEIQ